MMHRQKGFTLVELSVVLVVIALIIGGVVVGQSLIRSSQINSAVQDLALYTQAVKSFQDKYGALPGDFAGAEAIWGTDDRAGGCPNTSYSSVPYTKVCNGNGDGQIGLNGGGNGYEWFRVWQELSNAGFIAGSFTGVQGTSGSNDSIPGVNVPMSRVSGGGYTLYYITPTTVIAGGGWAANYNHVIAFGRRNTSTPWATGYPVVTPGEAYAIDTKIDDGRPAYGNVLSATHTAQPNCVTSDTPSTTAYSTTYSGIACDLLFITGF